MVARDHGSGDKTEPASTTSPHDEEPAEDSAPGPVDSTSPHDEEPAEDSAPGPVDTTAAEICTQYVACIAATNPGALSLIYGQYGANGSCWRDSPSLCEQACSTGLAQSHLAFPRVAECPGCMVDHHCTEAEAPACDRSTATCVQCAADRHCGPPTPACLSGAQVCVPCTEDAHCGTSKYCQDHTCVQCRGDSDCATPTPICTAGRCVEACSGDSQCPDGLCQSGRCCTPATCDEVTDEGFYRRCGEITEARCNVVLDCPCSEGTCLLGICYEVER